MHTGTAWVFVSVALGSACRTQSIHAGTARVLVQDPLPTAPKGYTAILSLLYMDLALAALHTVIVAAIAVDDLEVVVVVMSLLIVIVDFDFSAMALAVLTFVNRRFVTRRRRCCCFFGFRRGGRVELGTITVPIGFRTCY